MAAHGHADDLGRGVGQRISFALMRYQSPYAAEHLANLGIEERPRVEVTTATEPGEMGPLVELARASENNFAQPKIRLGSQEREVLEESPGCSPSTPATGPQID